MATSSEKIVVEIRKRQMINLEEKLKIFDLLNNGTRASCVARKFSVNHSTITRIKKKTHLNQNIKQD